MNNPAEGPPSMDQDPRANGLARQQTDPVSPADATPRSQSLTPHDRAQPPARSMTDPEQLAKDQQSSQNPQNPPGQLLAQNSPQQRPKRSGKICGKCGEGLTGQFVRALGGTYHLECFTCHVRRCS